MENLHTKYLIIGGGITGLTFASYVDDYLIIEKEATVGGYCRTTLKDGFVWDYAGHFFHFGTEEFRKRFLDAIASDEMVNREKCTKIIYKDELVDYPFQKNIHQLPKEEFIDCLYDLFTKSEKESYDNFLDMLYGKFGKSIVEKFLRPYNEKLYATDLSELDVDAMGRFFPYADKEDIIRNMRENVDSSYNNSFLYPKKGAQVIIDILCKQLDAANIRLNTSLISFDRAAKTARLSSGETVHYEYLISTIPLNVFVDVLAKDAPELGGRLSYNKVLVFNLGFNKKSSFDKEHWLYIPDKSCNYYRAGFYDNILGQDKLSMYIEIGYPKYAEITDAEIERQLALTLENLKLQGIIDDSFKLEAYETIVMDPAYVHINAETNKMITAYFAELKKDNIFCIGRYGAWTYCSMEDCMISAKELAAELKNSN